MPNQPSVAVITATIGRDELIKAIQSVQAQTYPCTHYVFVDGKDYHKKVKNLLKDDYPDVIVTYLPMNTGANKMYNSYINAITPFLVKEDILCFLDDDNWYDKDHVKHMAHYIGHYQANYAYSLRYYVSHVTDMVWEDNIESLGFWRFSEPIQAFSHFTLHGKLYEYISTIDHHKAHLIDVNCLAVTKSIALRLALVWIEAGFGNDRHITRTLLKSGIRGICTGKRTLYYRTSDSTYQLDPNILVKGGVLDQATADSLTDYERMDINHQGYANINRFIKQNECRPSPDDDTIMLLSWEIPTVLENQQITPIINPPN